MLVRTQYFNTRQHEELPFTLARSGIPLSCALPAGASELYLTTWQYPLNAWSMNAMP